MSTFNDDEDWNYFNTLEAPDNPEHQAEARILLERLQEHLGDYQWLILQADIYQVPLNRISTLVDKPYKTVEADLTRAWLQVYDWGSQHDLCYSTDELVELIKDLISAA